MSVFSNKARFQHAFIFMYFTINTSELISNKEKRHVKLSEVFAVQDPKEQAMWREWNGAKFLIAPVGNTLQKKETLKQFTLKEALELESKGPLAFADLNAGEAMEKIYGLYSRCVLMDWDIEDTKFSAAKALELMLEHDEFAAWVLDEANAVANERDKEKEAVAKK